MFFLKISCNQTRLSLTAAQITSDIPHQFKLFSGTATPHCIALYILVQHLVGIEVRAIAGKEEEADMPEELVV